jgi:DNA-binding response OmpR family regulator
MVSAAVTERNRTTRGKRVLVCDDERLIVRLIQINLERHGYIVLTAFDGKEGLEKARREIPDMIVMDLAMPYLDGAQVLRALRHDELTAEIPVILLTAQTEDSDVVHGYCAGADVFLPKPFDPMELVLFVDRLLESED